MPECGSVRLARNIELLRRRVAPRLERKRAAHTTGANGTLLLECRSYGCLVSHLYNTVRPHSSLGYKPPAPETWMTSTGKGCGEVETATRFPLLQTPDGSSELSDKRATLTLHLDKINIIGFKTSRSSLKTFVVLSCRPLKGLPHQAHVFLS
jgi:hypothetical protein